MLKRSQLDSRPLFDGRRLRASPASSLAGLANSPLTQFTPFMISFALTLGFSLLFIPVYIYGKRMRRWTRNSSLHNM